ncbi:MAG: DUF368 domain-containing protein [Niameybacter sp.]
MIKHIMNILYGIILGISNVIPGISAGTMAVVLNIYDTLLDAVSLSKNKLKENFPFLITIGMGMGIGIILFSNAITFLFEKYNMQTNFLFMGIIIGSIPMVINHAKEDAKIRTRNWIPFVVSLAIMTGMALSKDVEGSTRLIREVNLGMGCWFAVAGMISAFSMIIPGISGSFIMLTLGVYSSVITAVSEFNLGILIPVGIGVLVGLVGGVRIVKILLSRYNQATYMAILGLVVGSVFVIYPGFTFNQSGFFALICMCIGIRSTYCFADK